MKLLVSLYVFTIFYKWLQRPDLLVKMTGMDFGAHAALADYVVDANEALKFRLETATTVHELDGVVIVALLMKKTLLDHVRLAKGLITTPLRTDVRMQLGHSQ